MYGPDGRGGFSPALRLAAGAGAEVLALCDGRARALSPGVVLLLPAPAAAADLGTSLGADGALGLCYLGLDGAAGDAPFDAAAGAPLGRARTLELEAIWLPRGLSLDDPTSFARLAALCDPAARTRRLDPAALFAALDGRGPAALHPSHRGHPLLAALTRRALVELRDEHDRPLAAALSLRDAAGQRDLALTDGEWATAEVASGPVTIALAGCVLTDLPSGARAERTSSRTVASPSHWALQALYLPEPLAEVDEARCWFAPNVAPLRRYTENNRVLALRDGVAVFGEYTAALRTLTAPEHYAYLAGWFLDDGFALTDGDPATTFLALATAASQRGAGLRALLWDAALSQNSDPVDRLNRLPGAAAVLDDDTLPLGAHHQKMLLVAGAGQTRAFVGGVDVNPDRRDSPHHGAPSPFHDVQAQIEGPAVEELHRAFVGRWNDRRPHAKLPLAPPPIAPAGSAFAQVACTYPPRKRYPFAPQGSLAPLEALLRAIHRAQRFIYIEDQYLTPYPAVGPFDPARDTLGITRALRDALARIDFLVLVAPNHTDQPGGREMRGQFLRALTDVAPDKVLAFYLARPPHTPAEPGEVAALKLGARSGMSERPDEIYCHAKVWLVDDVCARIGSANCTRRSFTHDSEMDLVVVDGALDNGGRAFARRFRRELWGEQLGLADTAILEDPLRALALFRDPPPGARLRRYDDRAEETPLAREHAADFLDRLARHLRLEPARVSRAIAARSPAGTPLEQAIDDLRADPTAIWDLVDPDGRILE